MEELVAGDFVRLACFLQSLNLAHGRRELKRLIHGRLFRTAADFGQVVVNTDGANVQAFLFLLHDILAQLLALLG